MQERADRTTPEPEPAVSKSPAFTTAMPAQIARVLQLQQSVGNRAVQQLLQRDPAIEPPVTNPAEVTLTPQQIQAAIRFNSVLFTDAAELSVLRDVLGISQEPSVVDEDFINAVVRY